MAGVEAVALTLDDAIQTGRLDEFIAQAEAEGVAAARAEERKPKKKKHRNNPKQFFIVFAPTGETPPAKVHAHHSDALWVAWAMAKHNPGVEFFVMGSMSKPCLALAAGTQSAETNEDLAQSEGCQSGGDSRNAQPQSAPNDHQ